MRTHEHEPTPTDSHVARIVLLAGPSGSGKSHLAARVGVPTVCLDDFYKNGDDPTLPMSELGIVDWDHPGSWDADDALRALASLATTGAAELPVYDIGRDRRVGSRLLVLDTHERVVVAEGIFAARLVAACADAGILADAMCLVHRPIVTFWRRLVRDLREGRKRPLTLLRRGLALRAAEPAIVAGHIALGAEPVRNTVAVARLRRLIAESVGADRDDRDEAAA